MRRRIVEVTPDMLVRRYRHQRQKQGETLKATLAERAIERQCQRRERANQPQDLSES